VGNGPVQLTTINKIEYFIAVSAIPAHEVLNLNNHVGYSRDIRRKVPAINVDIKASTLSSLTYST
jgi:hypothetical protein